MASAGCNDGRMKSLDLIAMMGTTDEFVEAAVGVDVSVPGEGGKPLLRAALSHGDPEHRYGTAVWLLDHGAVLGGPDPAEGHSELHVLFSRQRYDISRDLDIAERLIALGADINEVSPRWGLPFFEVVFKKLGDEELRPYYDFWFQQPVHLDFETPSSRGASPMSYAKAVPFRAEILQRMERYVDEHGPFIRE